MRDTTRLRFREVTADDVEAIHAIVGDPDVVRFEDWGPYSLEETGAYVRGLLRQPQAFDRSVWTFAMIERDGGALIGTCGIEISERLHQIATIGYTLRRDRWGRGYATEASQELVRFGFETLKLRRIYASCSTKNVASVRVLQKIGMQLEGIMRQERLIHGRYHDSYLYAALASDNRNS